MVKKVTKPAAPKPSAAAPDANDTPQAERPTPEAKAGEVACNRCKAVYPKEKAVKREGQMCCPECYAPQEWKR